MVLKSVMQKLRGLRSEPRLVTTEEGYRLWAPSYPPHAHNPFMSLEESLMLAHLPSVQGLTILDLACGTGRYTHLLNDRGAAVISFDRSFDMLKRGIALIHITQADITGIPLVSNSLDGIVCGLAIGHVADLERALMEISRVLKPGGFALLSDLHPRLKEENAQRTFNAEGQTYAIEHYWHSESDYKAIAQEAGLKLTAQYSTGLPESPDKPLVWVLHLRKNA